MNEVSHSRRRFLQIAGASALSAGLLASINDVRALVDEQASAAARLDFDQLASAYSLADNLSYLNHASIGTIPRLVQSAHGDYLRLCESNPWLYVWGGGWDAGVQAVRAACAQALGCDASHVALSHNTTETFSMLAQGLPMQAGDEVLFSNLNHDGASICWEQQSSRRGYTVRKFEIPLADIPGLSEDDVVALHADAIADNTRVLVFPHVDNMVGLRHPLHRLVQTARAKGVEFVFVDGAQTLGMLPLQVASSGVDVYACSAHKWLQAPKGLGVSYIHPRLIEIVQPMWMTWGQQRWQGSVRIFEDYGTRNFPELMAMADALQYQYQLGAGRKLDRYLHLRKQAMAMVDADSALAWRSPRSEQLGASLFAIGLRNGQAEATAQRLYQQHGVVVRPFATPGLNSLRVSPNVFNTTRELRRLMHLAVN
ncbi:MAG: aminotransferase class V-fold PLP-dependent enzyme [Gammaproteobacteria bacterium]|nr:aminotransferase class V-fold PLP-dependent enzyme [Gammaproteobacteria bacterium]